MTVDRNRNMHRKCTVLISGVTSVGDTRGGNWGLRVSPLYFFLKNLATFFAHRYHYHYRFLLLSVGCHPLDCVTPHLFYLSDLVSPLFFVNLPTKKNFLRVSPPWRVSPGAVRPHPSDATGLNCTCLKPANCCWSPSDDSARACYVNISISSKKILPLFTLRINSFFRLIILQAALKSKKSRIDDRQLASEVPRTQQW